MGYKQDLARIETIFANHQSKSRISRAFDIRVPGSSHYAFSLTWTPGSLALAGDCGELTIVHYNALLDLKSGLQWAATSNYDYLLGKTRLRPSYDRDATLENLKDHMYRDAVDSLKAYRDELRDWRSTRPVQEEGVSDEDYQDMLADWAEYRPQRPEPHAKCIYPSRAKDYTAPDGWDMWLWALDTYSHETIRSLTTRKTTREVWGCIEDSFGETPESAYDVLCNLGLDGESIHYSYTFHDLLRVEAVRIGAAMALETLQYEEFAANPYSWSETDFWGSSTPPRSVFIDWIRMSVSHISSLPYSWINTPNGADTILREFLVSAGGGYNRPEYFVHVNASYGQKGLEWTPEAAYRIALDWFETAYEEAFAEEVEEV